MTMASAMNGMDSELAAFLRTVVSIESERPPAIEVLRSDVPKNTDVGYQNDPMNCIELQRVYYSFKGERMPEGLHVPNVAYEGLSHDISTATTRGCSTSNKDGTSTQAIHFGPSKISFSDQICEPISTDSFRRRKKRSIETINFQQQGNSLSVKKQRNCKIPEAENADYSIVSETFEETCGKTFEESYRKANVTERDQVEGKRIPRLCRSESRASSSRINGLLNSCHICTYNEDTELYTCNDTELQRDIQVTSEKTPGEVVKGKACCENAGPVMQQYSSNAVPYFQERHSRKDHFKERMNLAPPLKTGCDHSTTQRQTDQSHEIVAVEQTRKGCHATSIKEADKVLQKLLHPRPVHHRHADGTDYIMWNGKCHQSHQAFREYKTFTDKNYYPVVQGTSRGDEKVPPKSTFAFSQTPQSCSTVKATKQTTSILLRASQNVEAFSESSLSPAVLHDRKQKYFTSVPYWHLKNGLVSQENSFSVQERPTQQHVDSDRRNKSTNFERLGVSASLWGKGNPASVERSSNREFFTSLQSSEGIISRSNSFTPSLKTTTSSMSVNSDILNRKNRKSLALATKQKIFLCDFQSCFRMFNTRARLICHQQLHTGKRSFTCPWENCNRTFRRSDERLRHIRKHTGEKPYECPYCARCFSRSDHRRTHVRKIHNETELPVNVINS